MLLAETFVDPKRHRGTLYEVAGWLAVGESAGYSRQAVKYTEAHGEVKRMLRRDARWLLCRPDELPSCWQKKHKTSRHSLSELRSLHEDLSRIRDFCREQGRKPTLAYSLSILILAQLSGL